MTSQAICAGQTPAHLPPKLLRRKTGAFRHRLEFRPHDLRVDFGAVSGLRRKTAVAAGAHIFVTDKFGITHDSLSDELRMFDDIARVSDDSRNQDFAFG